MQTQTRKSPAVRPVDQLRSSARGEYNDETILGKAHNLFLRRVTFQYFNIAKFDQLIALQEEALEQNPHNAQLKYELAWTLVQNRADWDALKRAQRLIMQVLDSQQIVGLQADTYLPEDLLPKAYRLKELIEKMQMNATFNVVRPPRRVNWAVFNRCPMVCMGCYNNFSPDQLTIDEAKVGLDKLAEAGVKELIVSGGDPILWPDLPEFIEHAYDLGISVGVDTTGYTLTDELLERIGPKLSYIGLPLDGTTNEIQNGFRRGPKDIVDRTKLNLERCDRLGIRVKINTTVTQYSVDNLVEIGKIVSQHSCAENWSVFQWMPIRATDKLREEFAVPQDEFEAHVERLRTEFPDLDIRTRSSDERELTHFFVQNNGQVLTFGSELNEEFILGHILTDDIATLVQRPVFNKRSSKYVTTTRFSTSQPMITETQPNTWQEPLQANINRQVFAIA